MVRDGRLRLAHGPDEIAHAHFARGRGGQDRQDPEPCRVRQCAEALGHVRRFVGVERSSEDRRAAHRLGYLDHCTRSGHHKHLLLTDMNVSTMIDTSTVVNVTRRSPCPECNWP